MRKYTLGEGEGGEGPRDVSIHTRIEQIHDQREEEVQHEEDHVGFPADVGDGDRGDLHNHVVEDPVAGGGEGSAVGPMAHRHDFRGCVTLNQHIRITEVWEITHEKPRYWEPADGEDGFVEEEKGQGGLGSDGSDVFWRTPAWIS